MCRPKYLIACLDSEITCGLQMMWLASRVLLTIVYSLVCRVLGFFVLLFRSSPASIHRKPVLSGLINEYSRAT